jgi:hypothetical protein
LLPTKIGEKFKCGMRMKKCIKLVDHDVTQVHGEFVDDVLTVIKDYHNFEYERITFNTKSHIITNSGHYIGILIQPNPAVFKIIKTLNPQGCRFLLSLIFINTYYMNTYDHFKICFVENNCLPFFP